MLLTWCPFSYALLPFHWPLNAPNLHPDIVVYFFHLLAVSTLQQNRPDGLGNLLRSTDLFFPFSLPVNRLHFLDRFLCTNKPFLIQLIKFNDFEAYPSNGIMTLRVLSKRRLFSTTPIMWTYVKLNVPTSSHVRWRDCLRLSLTSLCMPNRISVTLQILTVFFFLFLFCSSSRTRPRFCRAWLCSFTALP